MSDDLHKHDDDHWRRLAEELGLPLDEFAPAAPRGESRSAERPPAQNEIRDAGPPPQRTERPTEPERPPPRDFSAEEPSRAQVMEEVETAQEIPAGRRSPCGRTL